MMCDLQLMSGFNLSQKFTPSMGNDDGIAPFGSDSNSCDMIAGDDMLAPGSRSPIFATPIDGMI